MLPPALTFPAQSHDSKRRDLEAFHVTYVSLVMWWNRIPYSECRNAIFKCFE